MSLVFSVNIYLKELELKDIGMIQPSICVSIANKGINYLWKGEEKYRDGEIINIDRAYQIMLTTNIFEAINQWKFQLLLTMARDQVPLGTSTFDFKPLIASALQRYGESVCIPLEANFHKMISNIIIATLKCKVKILYHPGTEHEKPVEIFMYQSIGSPISQDNHISPRTDIESPSNSSKDQSHISDEYVFDEDQNNIQKEKTNKTQLVETNHFNQMAVENQVENKVETKEVTYQMTEVVATETNAIQVESSDFIES